MIKSCQECGAIFDLRVDVGGTPEYCPFCGADLDYDEVEEYDDDDT